MPKFLQFISLSLSPFQISFFPDARKMWNFLRRLTGRIKSTGRSHSDGSDERQEKDDNDSASPAAATVGPLSAFLDSGNQQVGRGVVADEGKKKKDVYRPDHHHQIQELLLETQNNPNPSPRYD